MKSGKALSHVFAETLQTFVLARLQSLLRLILGSHGHDVVERPMFVVEQSEDLTATVGHLKDHVRDHTLAQFALFELAVVFGVAVAVECLEGAVAVGEEETFLLAHQLPMLALGNSEQESQQRAGHWLQTAFDPTADTVLREFDAMGLDLTPQMDQRLRITKILNMTYTIKQI